MSKKSTMKKKLRIVGAMYLGLSVLSTLFYCCCTAGSFYTLSTGEIEERYFTEYAAPIR